MKYLAQLLTISCSFCAGILLADNLPLTVTSARDLDTLSLDDKSTVLQTRLLKRIIGKTTNIWVEVSFLSRGDNSTNAARSSLLLGETQRAINGLDGLKSALLQKYPENELITVSFQEGDFHPFISFKNGVVEEMVFLVGNKKVNFTTNDLSAVSLLFKKNLAEAKP